MMADKLDEEDVYEFRLIELKDGGAWWYEYGEHPFSGNMAYLNFAGSGWDATGKEKVLRTTRASSFEDLDWSGTSLVQPHSEAGWLDRAGRFHGCYYTNHDDYARYVLKKTVGELEQEGWVRVYGDQKGLDMQWYFDACRRGLRLSAEQRMWLDRHGLKVDEDD